MIVGGPACVNTEAVTDPALPRPMSEDYQAPSGAGHPITPPPELFRQWEGMPRSLAFEAAYRAGADQELEACRDKVNLWSGDGDRLYAARRPKPPSLKEQALQALAHLDKGAESQMDTTEAVYTIRRALEQLND